MEPKKFLIELENLIKNKPIKEIKQLFVREENKFKGNKVELLMSKISDLFRKEKLSKFFKLSNTKIGSYESNIFNEEYYKTMLFKRELFKLAVENERVDFIDFLMKEKYVNNIDLQEVLDITVKSSKVVNHIINNYSEELTVFSFERMIIECCYNDFEKSLEEIFKNPTPVIKSLSSNKMYNFVFFAIEHNSNKVIKKLLDKDFPYQYDMNFITDDNKSFFSCAAKKENYFILNLLMSSYRLDFHTKVEKHINLIKDLPNLHKIFPLLTLTKELEQELNSHNLLKEYKAVCLTEKLNKKLPETNEKDKNIRKKF